MSRLLTGALLLLVGCSLGVSPGSYATGSQEAAPGPHLLAMGGERDAPNQNNTLVTDDVWVDSITSAGTVGAWGYDRAMPIDGYFQPYVIPGFLVANGYSPQGGDNYVLWAPFVGQIQGDWQEIEIKNEQNNSTSILTGANLNTLVVVGGETSGETDTYYDTVFQSTIDRQALTATTLAAAPSKLSSPRDGFSLLQYQNFLYAIGGGDGGGAKGYADVAPLDGNGAVTANFAATTQMQNEGKPYNVSSPGLVANNGYLYVIGGSLGQNTPSDLVLVGQVNAADGTVPSWQPSTKLPTPLSDLAVAVSGGYIYIVGGSGATSRSNAVYAIKILDTGMLDTAWQTTTALPVTRSDLGVTAY